MRFQLLISTRFVSGMLGGTYTTGIIAELEKLGHTADVHYVSDDLLTSKQELQREIERLYEKKPNAVWLTMCPALSHFIDEAVTMNINRSRFITMPLDHETQAVISVQGAQYKMLSTWIKAFNISKPYARTLFIVNHSDLIELAPNGMETCREHRTVTVFDPQLLADNGKGGADIQLYDFGAAITPQLDRILGKV